MVGEEVKVEMDADGAKRRYWPGKAPSSTQASSDRGMLRKHGEGRMSRCGEEAI
jgi:hypothetical protein